MTKDEVTTLAREAGDGWDHAHSLLALLEEVNEQRTNQTQQ